MKGMAKYLLLLILFSLASSLYPQNLQPASGQFRWAFFQTDVRGDISTLERAALKAADPQALVQLFFRPVKNAYLYLLLFGPRDSLSILFPESFAVFGKKYFTFEKHIPMEGSILAGLKDTGEYELHVLVVEKRVEELETLIEDYRGTETEKNSSYKRMKIRKDILSVINRIKRQYLLPDTIRRTFIDEAGVSRTNPGAVLNDIEDIEFSGLYSEIIVIDYTGSAL